MFKTTPNICPYKRNNGSYDTSTMRGGKGLPPSKKISRERLQEQLNDEYAREFLKPAFEFQRAHFYHALVDTHRAWVIMLLESGLVPRDHVEKLLRALNELRGRGPDALGEFDPAFEYFYSHLEHLLTKQVGEEVAGHINIGRTRPEPLVRMVLREKLIEVLEKSHRLRRQLLSLADGESDTIMPQWTHFQPAQPATLGHYLLAIVDLLARDERRLVRAYETVNECTLGCGALAGTSYAINRERVATLLGFEGVRENSLDCVATADHMSESGAGLAGMMVSLSRFCHDLYVWSTWEFGFAEIDDSFSGSSSMMPQKKNPYPFEYIRSRAALVIAQSSAVFEITRNTPFQDLKDVEEEAVYPLFDAVEHTGASLELLGRILRSVKFNRDRLREQAAAGYSTTTELAALIHRKTDMSYRTAHRIVGHVVARAVAEGADALEISTEWIDEASRQIVDRSLHLTSDEVRKALDPDSFVRAHSSTGGTAPAEVRRMLSNRIVTHQRDEAQLASMRLALKQAKERLDTEVDAVIQRV